MKKHILFFAFYLFVNFCFVFSAIATQRNTVKNYNDMIANEASLFSNETIKEPEYKYVYSANKIRVFDPVNKLTEAVDIEEYVTGVLTGEMYGDEGDEALKAMSIAARTYALYMSKVNKDKAYDVVADPSVSQAYISKENALEVWKENGIQKYEKMKTIVAKTEGMILTYESEPICALYHASSYPRTENSENVFIEALPYLKSVTSEEAIDNTYRSYSEYCEDELNEILSVYGFPEINIKNLNVTVLKNENERCSSLKISDENVCYYIDGKDIRKIFSLKSNSFTVKVQDGKIRFEVYGFGHGVGLSQNGAKIMAEKGIDHERILRHYYPGTEISKTIYKE